MVWAEQSITLHTMTKREKEARAVQAVAYLKEYLHAGDRVYTILNSVSRSGMSRHIDVVIPTVGKGGQLGIYKISHLVADALDYRRAKDGSLIVGGCGMDMGYSVAYSLSRLLFRDEFYCIGDMAHTGGIRCASNDHHNGDPLGYKLGHKHSDGGYALTHSWI